VHLQTLDQRNRLLETPATEEMAMEAVYPKLLIVLSTTASRM